MLLSPRFAVTFIAKASACSSEAALHFGRMSTLLDPLSLEGGAAESVTVILFNVYKTQRSS